MAITGTASGITPRTTIGLGLVAGIVAAALAAAGAFWAATGRSDVSIAGLAARLEATAGATSRNEITIEAARSESRTGIRDMDGKLVRIEDKLDRLIERLSTGGRR